ncbi:hypothetical protein [Xanthobacter versatilis]|uniref:hypothetical protein n=1 Tax=Xanthobacter autotrophicus (strain ATCC BAA-1158 / Py2) TaxID=78245 RepID=UPI0037274E92
MNIEELREDGRLSSYILDKRVGIHVKHSASRLHPWQFTFTQANILQISMLKERCATVFIVLVCHSDGMVAITFEEINQMLETGRSDQAWVRVDRQKNKCYSVTGGLAELGGKRPQGLIQIIHALDASR